MPNLLILWLCIACDNVDSVVWCSIMCVVCIEGLNRMNTMYDDYYGEDGGYGDRIQFANPGSALRAASI